MNLRESFSEHFRTERAAVQARRADARIFLTVHDAISRAIAALTLGDDAQRHFDLAAEHIQRTLLEVRIPAVTGVEIGVHAEPARLVGGDYIDLTREGDMLVFGLGDASGKSLAAALHAMSLRYLVRGLVRALGPRDLATILAHTNAVVCTDIHDDQFITFVLGALDCTSGELHVANAGHEPPLLLRRASQTVEPIDAHGIVLGVHPDSAFTSVPAQLHAGDVLVLYTDGLTEATDKDGEQFTIDRLMNVVLIERDQPVETIAERIFLSVKNHAARELRDDATVLVLRWRSSAG